MENLILILMILILISVVLTTVTINLIHTVFWLTATFGLSSLFLFAIDIKTVACIVILIYMGAIAILFVFSIMMLDLIRLKDIQNIRVAYLPLGILVMISFLLIKFSNCTSIWNNNFDPFLVDSEKTIFSLGLDFLNLQSWSIVGCGLMLVLPMIGSLVFI